MACWSASLGHIPGARHKAKGELSKFDEEAALLALSHCEPLAAESLSVCKRLRAMMMYLHLPDLPPGWKICSTFQKNGFHRALQHLHITDLVYLAQSQAVSSWRLPHDATVLAVQIFMRALLRMGLVVCCSEIPANGKVEWGNESYQANLELDYVSKCQGMSKNGDSYSSYSDGHWPGNLDILEEHIKDLRERLGLGLEEPLATDRLGLWEELLEMNSHFSSFLAKLMRCFLLTCAFLRGFNQGSCYILFCS